MSFLNEDFEDVSRLGNITQQLLIEKAKEDIIHAISSPFNFYAKVSDLLTDQYLYFVAWSLGKVKNILWGHYDSQKDEFVIEGECGYQRLSEVNAIVKEIESLGYNMVFNILQDLIPKVIASLTGMELPDDAKVNRNDVDISSLGDLDEKKAVEIKKYLQRVSDKFQRVIEVNANYVVKTVEKACASPQECVKNSILNFMSSNVTEDQLERCKLYYNGEPTFRKSKKYIKMVPTVKSIKPSKQLASGEAELCSETQGPEPVNNVASNDKNLPNMQ
jgi:hypothetical protein